MNAAEIAAYCLRKRHVTQTYPFGSIPVCFKLNGRIFAQLYPNSDFFRLTLKCTREMGEFYRRVYPEKVRRGYHCPPVQQPYWNTIDLENFPSDALMMMIDQAYDTVLNGFPRRIREQLTQGANAP